MMKKSVHALLCVAALGFTGMASAQMLSNTYVGFGVGSTSVKLNSSDFAGATSKDESDTGYKIFAGYRFNQTWAVEAAYANLGEGTATFVGSNGRGEADSWSVAGVGTWPLARGFSLLAKAGVTFNRAETRVTGAGGFSASKSKTDLLWGLGGSYDFTPRIAARLEYENYGKFGETLTTTQSGRYKADMLSASLVFRF